MIYTHTLDSFNLSSSWSCISYQTTTSNWVWKINKKPSQDTKVVVFPVSLPSDAVIRRAWVSMKLGSPLTGAAYKRLNDIDIPSSGEVDVEGITAESTEFEARFTFKANGAVYQDAYTHTSSLGIGSPTLNVEYSSEIESAPLPDEDDPGNITRDPEAGLQLPRLLNSDLGEVARIPAKVSLDLQIDPLSSATMEIPWGMHAVNIRDYMELFDPDGSVGIFRVSKTEETVGRSTRVWLKHVFTTLDDDLAVGVKAIEGTFREVVSSILAAQTVPRWTLGDVELPDEYTILYSASYDTLMTAITGIFEKLPHGYMWVFDTLQYPWVMHLRAMPDDDLCEGRLNRNLESVKITWDDRNLCTRVYPFGAGEGDERINLSTLTGSLYMDAETRDVWGNVSRTFTEDDIFDAISLQDVAKLYLDRNKDPLVSITLNAMALYQLTGETLDRFYPGRLCRLSIPDCGVVMNERVISISYSDVYGSPEKATVTLANHVRDSFDSLANLIREASGAKLIGGTVKTNEIKSSSSDVTSNSPKVKYFDITEYGNLLSAKVRYTALQTGGGSVRCRVTVDGNGVTGAEDMPQPIDILRYLRTDDNGIPTVGEHYVRITPVASSSSLTHWVNCTITLKTIEKN